jgi:hypothetical protein
MRMGTETYHTLRSIIQKKYGEWKLHNHEPHEVEWCGAHLTRETFPFLTWYHRLSSCDSALPGLTCVATEIAAAVLLRATSA